MRRDANLIGRNTARLRNQRNLTQSMLVARLQLLGCDITRDVLCNIELQRYAATDQHAYYLAKALKVEIRELFPS
ncbi:XRE family transcriptional regulator [bacterium]|nr:XRE family transcriptional regulator [bacterium]